MLTGLIFLKIIYDLFIFLDILIFHTRIFAYKIIRAITVELKLNLIYK